MNTECATFRLSTLDIDENASGTINNEFGKVDPIKSDTTWNNVNFRNILGDMLYKYDKFNLKLHAIQFTTVATGTTSIIELLLKINIVGLPFSNCNYDFKKQIVDYSVIGLYTLTTSRNIYYPDSNFITIHRPSENTNIRIYLTTIDNQPPDWTTFIGQQFEFVFQIYGVKD